MQVDQAIDEYRRREDELRRLVRDSEDVIAETAAQMASHREAAELAARQASAATDPAAIAKFQTEGAEYEQVAAEFQQQLTEQRVQNEQLHAELSKASATLKSLQSQRDFLHARLQAAQARIGIDAGNRPGKIKRALVRGAAVVALIAIAWIGSRFFATAVTRELRHSSAADQSRIGVPAAGRLKPVEFPLGESVDVLNLIDISRDTIRGSWLRTGPELVSDGPRFSRAEIPIKVDGSYDLDVEFTRPRGNSDAAVILSIGSHPFLLSLSAWRGAASGIMKLKGLDAKDPENPIAVHPGTLVNRHRYRLSIRARTLPKERGSLDVSLDGKPYLPHWEGDLDDLSVPRYWGMGFPNRLELGAGSNVIIFHSAKLRMVSGQAVYAPSPLPADLRGPAILSARWESGPSAIDVTKIVRSKVENGSPVWATNEFFNKDPARGYQKELWISYRSANGDGEFTVPEGDKWAIGQYGRLGPTAPNPPAAKAAK